LKPPFKGKVLDVGCGCGAALDKLSNLGFDVEGIDIHPENVVTSGYPLSRVDLNSEFLPFHNESFDIVVCTEVLEHLFYPHFVLREISRVLKRGTGYAILSIPNEFHLYQRLYVFLGRQMSTGIFEINSHHYFPTVSSGREFIQSAFVIEEKICNFRPPFCKLYPNLFARNVYYRVHPK
jgi:2-polyprenyl-3-methyl-5-hydroxy-6-metoxy-1,4-benzoquinol methylase